MSAFEQTKPSNGGDYRTATRVRTDSKFNLLIGPAGSVSKTGL
jgi:hypothetical protein